MNLSSFESFSLDSNTRLGPDVLPELTVVSCQEKVPFTVEINIFFSVGCKAADVRSEIITQ